MDLLISMGLFVKFQELSQFVTSGVKQSFVTTLNTQARYYFISLVILPTIYIYIFCFNMAQYELLTNATKAIDAFLIKRSKLSSSFKLSVKSLV